MKKSRNLYDEEKANSSVCIVLNDLVEKHGKKDELRDYLGVTSETINSYLRGASTPPAKNLYKIAEFYGCSVNYLTGLSKVQTPDASVEGACNLTGLSEDAIYRLASLDDELKWSASDFISSDHFADFITAFSNLYDFLVATDSALDTVEKGWNKDSSMEDLDRVGKAFDSLVCNHEIVLMGFRYSVIDALSKIINEFHFDDFIRDIHSLKKSFDEDSLMQRMGELHEQEGQQNGIYKT